MATDTPTEISMNRQIPKWDHPFDVLLIGHRRMGKSTLIRRVTGISDVESGPIVATFNTNYGKITMRIDEWDINEYANEDSYKRVEGVIILLGYPYTSKSIIFTDLRTLLEDDLGSSTHTVFAYNKNDLLQDLAEKSVHLISALTGENCLAPFLELAQKMTEKPDLVFRPATLNVEKDHINTVALSTRRDLYALMLITILLGMLIWWVVS